MISEQTLRNFIIKRGHIPASPSICIEKINKLPQNRELKFYVNPHNLCWLVDDRFIDFHGDNKNFSGVIINTNVRDIKLEEYFN